MYIDLILNDKELVTNLKVVFSDSHKLIGITTNNQAVVIIRSLMPELRYKCAETPLFEFGVGLNKEWVVNY